MSEETHAEDLKLFNKTYPRDTRMPFQGAWPIDFWELEATAFSNPELWWRHELECTVEGCGAEPAQWTKATGYRCETHR